jgi:hypothetical protein
MAEIHRRANNQDMGTNRHYLKIAAITEPPHRAMQISYTKRSTSISEQSLRARSSSG